jgi:hypothetical protein
MPDFGALFVRLCAIGPLLYIAVVLITDPAALFWMRDGAITGMRAFEERLRGRDPLRRVYSSQTVRITRSQWIAVQGAGVLLIVLSFFAIAA